MGSTPIQLTKRKERNRSTLDVDKTIVVETKAIAQPVTTVTNTTQPIIYRLLTFHFDRSRDLGLAHLFSA